MIVHVCGILSFAQFHVEWHMTAAHRSEMGDKIAGGMFPGSQNGLLLRSLEPVWISTAARTVERQHSQLDNV